MKRRIEKNAVRIGVGFMVLYTCAAAAVFAFKVNGLARPSDFALVAILQGLGFLMSLVPVWTGVTRFANPKLKVSYQGYSTETGRAPDGQEVRWSKPEGKRTATYTRPFALLALGLGLAVYGGAVLMTWRA